MVTIANCALEAVTISAYRLAEKKSEEAAERIYERLVKIFTPKLVDRAPIIMGASNTQWHVAALVRNPGRQSVFEPVTAHHQSVVTAAAKFHDISRLPSAPIRIAVVRKKQPFGTLLGVLSQAANVIEEDVPDRSIRRLAIAA